MSSVRPPPGSPPKRSKSRSNNPRYTGNGSSRNGESPVEEVFPRKKRNTNRQNNQEDNAEQDFRLKVRQSTAKLGKKLQQGGYNLKKAFFRESDSEETDFDVDQINDYDYEKRIQDIEDLPFYERMIAKKVPGRFAIACTAIILIWVTCLAVIRLIVAKLIFPSPTYSEVNDEFDFLFERIEGARDGHDSCASIVSTGCQVLFTDESEEEKQRTDTILDSQDAQLILFEESRSRSKSLVNDTLQALVAAGNIDDLLLVSDLSECPRIQALADSSLASSSALSRQLQVEALTNTALDDLASSFNRQQNFSDTFWANKDVEFAQLNLELSSENAARVEEIQNNLNSRLFTVDTCLASNNCNGVNGDGLFGIIDRFNSTTEGDTDNKESTYQNVDDSVRELLRIMEGVANTASQIGINVVDVEVREVEFDNFFQDGSASLNLGDVGSSAMNGVGDAIGQAGNNSANAADQFASNAASFVFADIEPYNPPVLDDSAQTQYESDQDERNNGLSDNLNAAQQNNNEDTFLPPSERQTNTTAFVENVVSVLDGRDLAFFSYPASVFESIELGLANVLNVAIYMDIIFRIALTISTWYKYWHLSSIGKPPGDVRVEELVGKQSGTKKTAEQKCFDRVFHPAVLNLITIIFTFFIVAAIYAIYRPFYEEFIDGCRNNDIDTLAENNSTGTMLFNNMQSAAIAFAAQDGDSTLTTTIDILNNNREIDCETNTLSTVTRTEDQFEIFATTNEDYQNTLSLHQEVLKCVDLAELDSQEGTTSVVDMSDDAFTFNVPEIQSGVYNCDAISLCDVAAFCPIEIVSFDQVLDQAFVTSCDAEQYLHSSIFSFLLIVLIFVTMFIFRKNFMRALVRLFWRDLNPYDFNILATCLRDGTHLDPERVSEDGFTLQDTATLELHNAIKEWERESWLYMIVAFVLHAPWIFGAVYLKDGFH